MRNAGQDLECSLPMPLWCATMHLLLMALLLPLSFAIVHALGLAGDRVACGRLGWHHTGTALFTFVGFVSLLGAYLLFVVRPIERWRRRRRERSKSDTL